MTERKGRSLCGRKRVLTPEMQAQAQAWYAALKAMGTVKTKAEELGISEGTLRTYLNGKHQPRPGER